MHTVRRHRKAPPEASLGYFSQSHPRAFTLRIEMYFQHLLAIQRTDTEMPSSH